MSDAPSHMRYQPFYCEENVWHLCQVETATRSAPHVVVVSNQGRRVVMWSQRAAPAHAPIAWDYHVFMIAHGHGWQVWDLDFRPGMPVPLQHYLEATFATVGVQPPYFDPTFRIMTADEYCRNLCSDRSHMRSNDGSWRAPPPTWPCISEPSHGSNLERFFDMSEQFLGVRTDLPGLREHFAVLAPGV